MSTKAITPSSQAESQDFRLLLQQELLSRISRNSAYSLRSFAKFLQTDYSTLSKILNGKRPLGKKAVKRLGDRLGLTPTQLNQYTDRASSSRFSAAAEAQYQQLTLDSFQVIADWYHFAILELIRVDSFQPTARWISKALGISINTVNAAKERLIRVRLLHVSDDGKTWSELADEKLTVITPEESSRAQRLLQRQILEKAITALESTPISKRNQTAMTMAVDVSRLPEAKEKIKKFRRSMGRFLSRSKSAQEVYNLSISLYPVSEISPKGTPT